MTGSLRSLHRRMIVGFLKDEHGTSVIEFALLAPLFALFTVGIADLGQALAAKFTLEQAVSRTLEMAQARPTRIDADQSAPDDIPLVLDLSEAADVSPSDVQVVRWLECDGVKQAQYTGGCADEQETARYLKLEVSKDFDGKFMLGAIALHAAGALRTQ